MENLPFELYRFLFNYLDYKDILKLRLVSKRINRIILDQFKIEELIINERNLLYDFKLKDLWTFSNLQINFKNSVNHLNSSFLECSSSATIFTNLKRLRIANVSGSNAKIKLSDLNQLNQLIQLEIHYNKCEIDCKLNLPNLKVLVIKSSIQMRMQIDCSNLKYLNFNYDTFEFVEFESIDNISHFLIDGHDKNVFRFRNLVYYELNTATNLDATILLALSNLKELRINFHCFNEIETLNAIMNFKRSDYNLEDDLRDNLRDDLEDHSVELKNDLKVYYKGIKLIKRMPEFEFKDRLHLQLTNYNSLSDFLPFEYSICYNNLISYINHQLPENFHQKYNNIQIIETKSKIENQSNFSSFIKNCKTLYELILFKSELDQHFYYDLIHLTSSLIILRIHEHEDFRLNFDFIHKMSYLEQLTTNLKLSNQLSLDKLFKLKAFTFKTKADDHINFFRQSNNRNYEIKFGNRAKLKFQSLKDVYEWTNQLIEEEINL